MIRIILLLCAILTSLSIHGQQELTPLSTEIHSATVFLKSATVQRSGKINLTNGNSTLVVKGLSPYINAKSIKVKGEGDFTVLGVDHKLNYIDKVEKSILLKSLEDQTKTIQKANRIDKARLDILSEKKSLLKTNQKIGTAEKGVTVEAFRATMAFYEEQLSAISAESIQLNYAIEDRKKEYKDFLKQITSINEKKSLPTGEITIKIDAHSATDAMFEISYLVTNAGWYPKYDVRVPDIDQPLQVVYKAAVNQNTGVDWNNVKLKFSNGTPNQSGQAPALNPWRLDYTWNTVYNNSIIDPSAIRSVSGTIRDGNTGEGLIGANVMIVGTTIGTATDIDGRYELTLPNQGRQLEVSYTGYASQILNVDSHVVNVSMSEGALLEEVVVTGYARQLQGRAAGVSISRNNSVSTYKAKKEAKINQVTVVENTTTVEFAIDKPYTLKSESTSTAIQLKQYDIDAIYEYIAVPKIESSAFLIAKLPNWDQYNLLAGEANLYFQDTYIGRTILDAQSISDTLELSMGRDQNILVGRTKINTFNKRQTVGNNQIDNRTYEIMVRNKKSKPINITVIDQVPVAANNDITVKLKSTSDAQVDETSGEIQWKLIIPGTQQTTKVLEYEVKYPKSGNIALE